MARTHAPLPVNLEMTCKRCGSKEFEFSQDSNCRPQYIMHCRGCKKTFRIRGEDAWWLTNQKPEYRLDDMTDYAAGPMETRKRTGITKVI